jgi:hypothetical protein
MVSPTGIEVMAFSDILLLLVFILSVSVII